MPSHRIHGKELKVLRGEIGEVIKKFTKQSKIREIAKKSCKQTIKKLEEKVLKYQKRKNEYLEQTYVEKTDSLLDKRIQAFGTFLQKFGEEVKLDTENWMKIQNQNTENADDQKQWELHLDRVIEIQCGGNPPQGTINDDEYDRYSSDLRKYCVECYF